MYVTTEAVNSDPKLGLDNPSTFFAFAWLLVLASALACTVGGAMAFASAITANLGTRLAAHAGRGRAQPLRVASAKAIVALEGRPWSRVFAFALALSEGVDVTAVIGRHVQGPSRGWIDMLHRSRRLRHPGAQERLPMGLRQTRRHAMDPRSWARRPWKAGALAR